MYGGTVLVTCTVHGVPGANVQIHNIIKYVLYCGVSGFLMPYCTLLKCVRGCVMLLPRRAMCVFLHQCTKFAKQPVQIENILNIFLMSNLPQNDLIHRCPTVFMRLSLYPLVWTICTNNRGTTCCNLLYFIYWTLHTVLVSWKKGVDAELGTRQCFCIVTTTTQQSCHNVNSDRAETRNTVLSVNTLWLCRDSYRQSAQLW